MFVIFIDCSKSDTDNIFFVLFTVTDPFVVLEPGELFLNLSHKKCVKMIFNVHYDDSTLIIDRRSFFKIAAPYDLKL